MADGVEVKSAGTEWSHSRKYQHTLKVGEKLPNSP